MNEQVKEHYAHVSKMMQELSKIYEEKIREINAYADKHSLIIRTSIPIKNEDYVYYLPKAPLDNLHAEEEYILNMFYRLTNYANEHDYQNYYSGEWVSSDTLC